MIQKVDSSASGHLQSQELCSVIQAKLDGKSPYFYANQKHCKTKRVANCVHAGLRILEPSRLQTIERTKPIRNYRKPPNSSWPDRLGTNGKNWSGFQQTNLK
jgi:hypothetical protein